MIFKKHGIINKHFADNWTETPVQYESIPFDDTGVDAWISLELYPEDATKEGDTGMLKVLCYDTSATLVYLLADKVKTFLDNAQFDGVTFDIGKGDGLGIVPIGNDTYQTALTFDIMAIDIKC